MKLRSALASVAVIGALTVGLIGQQQTAPAAPATPGDERSFARMSSCVRIWSAGVPAVTLLTSAPSEFGRPKPLTMASVTSAIRAMGT